MELTSVSVFEAEIELVTMIRPPPCRLQIRNHDLQGQEDRGHVGRHHAVPHLERQVLERAGRVAFAGAVEKPGSAADAGVREHHVEPPVALDDAGERLAQRVRLRHVGDFAANVEALILQALDGDGQRLRIDIDEIDPGAVGGHDLGIGQPDPAGGTGDGDDAAFDVEQFLGFHVILFCIVI